MKPPLLSTALRSCLLAGFLAGCTGRLHAERLDLSERTVSSSRQFVIYANEHSWRGGVASVAEETKQWLLNKLRIRDSWKHPIVISIERASIAMPGRAPANLRIFQTEIGPKIQLDLVAGPTNQPVTVRAEIIRAILAELSIESVSQQVPPDCVPPDWLATGFAVLFENQERNLPASFYEALLVSGIMPDFEEFTHRKTGSMDSTTLKIHRAFAGALVQSLLDLPGGREGILVFLKKQALNPGNQYADLREAIPDIGAEDGGMEKWWSLGLARMSAGDRHELRNVEDTASRLVDLLKIQITDKSGEKKTYSLSEYKTFEKFPDTRRAMTQLLAEISQFGATANPLLVPVLESYGEIVRLIAVRKTKQLGERIAKADQFLVQLTKLGTEATDYLNWVEATQIKVQSGNFTNYLQSANAGPTARPRRNDSISLYLDAIEMEMQ